MGTPYKHVKSDKRDKESSDNTLVKLSSASSTETRQSECDTQVPRHSGVFKCSNNRLFSFFSTMSTSTVTLEFTDWPQHRIHIIQVNGEFKDLSSIFTVRNCGKVMFLDLPVSHSVHGCVCLSRHSPPADTAWADTP